MKKTKLTALALAALITFGGMANSAFAAALPASTVQMSSTDKVASPISNENFVKSITGITEQEKALLLSTYNEIDKIGEQINAICGDKKELDASEQKKVDSLSKQIDELCKKVSNIESKIPNIEKIDVDGDKVASPISNENFVKSLNGITDQEKALLLKSYNEIDKIGEQINAIWGDKKELNASEQKNVDILSKQLDELCKKARNIESKVSDSEKIFGSDSNQEIVEINN